MKSLTLLAIPAFLLCASLPSSFAEDKPIKIDKSTTDKAKDMLDKLVGEVKNAADKGDSKGHDLWPRSKENLKLSREDYVKKVNSALKAMDAEIASITESGAALVSRDYYKTRLESLKQHLDYCKRDLERLQASETEEVFRAKQKGFDRGLGYLGDHIELAQEEAGL